MKRRRSIDGAAGPDMEAPDYAEPIVGWRLWSVVVKDGVQLRSLFHACVWPRREPLEAVCERWRLLARVRGREHETPAERCTCGIYASDLGVVGEYLEEPPGIGVETLPRVLGLVSLWGSVLECERGWRASHAYPAAIYVPTFARGTAGDLTPEELAAGLADYGVPVEVVSARRPEDLLVGLERRRPRRRWLSNLGGNQ